MDPAPTSPSVIYIGQHGTSASGFATIAWLEATPDDWPHVTRRLGRNSRTRHPPAIESRSTPKSFDLWNLKAQPPTTAANAHSQTHSTPSATRTSASAASTPAPRPTTTGPSKTRTPHRTPPTNQHPTRRRRQVRNPLHHNRTPPTPEIRLCTESSKPPHPHTPQPAHKWPTSSPGPRTNTSPTTTNRTSAGTFTKTFATSTSTANRLRSTTETHWAEVEYASTTTESTR